MPTAALLNEVRDIALRAGDAVLAVYATDFAVRGKADASPVTEADEQAEAIIVAALRSLTPDVPVVAEEAVAAGCMPTFADRFWLVDPLDGTREFVARNGEFTINIALVHDGVPVLGVLHAPALQRLYAGIVGGGAFVEEAGLRREIRCRTTPPGGITVVASRSHGDAQALAAHLAGRRVAGVSYAGSALKLGLIASGEADLYPRFGRTMEWDTAAGHAVILAAGGSVTDLDGRPLRYGKPGFENPHFIASGAAPASASLG
ncbi:MAG TPA: 3'(2'),5'-bisphosphate nucleotidase CysQ [Albitalea sp.]|nr:3'(2'),5'-bisphosphate nucleotidase CysQ [Albitalea sp.]